MPERKIYRAWELPEDASAWDEALTWIQEGLYEIGDDTADPEAILLAAYSQREMEGR